MDIQLKGPISSFTHHPSFILSIITASLGLAAFLLWCLYILLYMVIGPRLRKLHLHKHRRDAEEGNCDLEENRRINMENILLVSPSTNPMPPIPLPPVILPVTSASPIRKTHVEKTPALEVPTTHWIAKNGKNKAVQFTSSPRPIAV